MPVVEIILSSGVFGALALLFFVLLFPSTLLILLFGSSRASRVAAFGMACIPCLLGLTGTGFGLLQIRRVAAMVGSISRPEIQQGIREAWYATWLGLGLTLILILALVVTALIKNAVTQGKRNGEGRASG